MKRLSIFSFLLFLLTSLTMQAQVPDSLVIQKEQEKLIIEDTTTLVTPIDTTTFSIDSVAVLGKKRKGKKAKKDRFLYKVFNKDYPNPKTAMLLSFALPGTGQIYNKRWWKPPLVYGGMGWSIYSIIRNTNKYKEFRDAYISALAGEEHKYSGTRLDNPGDLKTIRDGYDKNRQLSFVAAIVVYGIQGAEAFVDAHLKTFDVSDDLSLSVRLKPSFEVDELFGSTTGVGLSFRLDKKTPTPPIIILP